MYQRLEITSETYLYLKNAVNASFSRPNMVRTKGDGGAARTVASKVKILKYIFVSWMFDAGAPQGSRWGRKFRSCKQGNCFSCWWCWCDRYRRIKFWSLEVVNSMFQLFPRDLRLSCWEIFWRKWLQPPANSRLAKAVNFVLHSRLIKHTNLPNPPPKMGPHFRLKLSPL